jgi:predicted MFS family arabinose efflux permease
MNPEKVSIPTRTVRVMSLACAVSVANIYYCQPLLSGIAHSLGVPDHEVGYLPMWTQAGTAIGMVGFVPLGDMFPRRRLIVTMCLATVCALTLMTLAPGLALISAAGFLTGLATVVPHLVLPFAAKLSRDDERGRVVGSILGGLLTGILLARVVAGYVGEAFGWRAMYGIAAVAMAALAVIMRYGLPYDKPDSNLRYGQLLRSIGQLIADEPVLREAAITGGMLFGAFSSFWSTLVFFLGAPPYHYGARAAGLFGIVGLAGALVAPVAGRLSDRRGPAFTVALGILTALASWLVFALFGYTLAGLIAGVILLDLGVQAGHVANQTRIYALIPQARSRLNTVYMGSYFIGGAIGSALGAAGWSQWGWKGVCAAGALQCLVALAARSWGYLRTRAATMALTCSISSFFW